MSILKLEKMSDVRELIVNYSRPANLLKAAAVLAVSYVSYKTLSVYLKRRKYQHIPGPSPRKCAALF